MKPTAPSTKPKRSGCFWAALIVLVLVLGLSLALNIGLLIGSAARGDGRAMQVTGRAMDEYPQFTTRWSFGRGDTVVVRIPLQGVIMREATGGLFSPRYDPVQLTLNRIRAAENDRQVRGIILEVDSPGGAVTPSDEIYNALQRFRASAEGRKVIIFSRDINASGAYYVSMAGDWLMAEPTTLVGSIGVMIQTLNWHQLSERIGVSDTTIKSGSAKDILNPFRDVSEREMNMLQHLVDSLHARFSSLVQQARGVDGTHLETITDGRIFTAPDALQAGLIDEIGYWDDVVARTAQLFGVSSVRVLRYERRPDWSDWFASVRHTEMQIPSWLDPDRPRILYLWRP